MTLYILKSGYVEDEGSDDTFAIVDSLDVAKRWESSTQSRNEMECRWYDDRELNDLSSFRGKLLKEIQG